MSTIHITTAEAKFYFGNKQMSEVNAHALAGRRAHNYPDSYVCVYNNAGEVTYEVGDKAIVPQVWTHVPVPFGMDLVALQKKFEERAVSVLGDYHNGTPQLLKCVPDGPFIWKDNRYYCEGVRMAWMMYVDLAIEHFVKGGL